MEDISNKTLALLLGVAIVVSLVGIFTAESGTLTVLTGRGTTETSNVTFTTESETNIKVDGNITFGSGRVDLGQTFAILDSGDGSTTNGNWSFSAHNISITNEGTVNVSVSVQSDKTPATFIGGGTNPEFAWKAIEAEANACVGDLNDTYTDHNFTTSATTFCTNLASVGTANQLDMPVRLTVPEDATTGDKNAQLTFTATSV
ncbi:hypothetical protein KY337_02250 [Candidatus Woesearchaeota archaeon]|nr:hypothetical protein [Candidatus Woesearchaeota archaeon]